MDDISFSEGLLAGFIALLIVGGYIGYCLWRLKKQTDNLT